MNTRLISALISVASESTAAKKLVEEVLTSNDSPLVRELYQRIDKLEKQLADLTSSAVEPVEISEVDRRQLVINLSIKLKDLDWDALCRFDRTYLRLYPRETRSLVATVLRNRAVELGQTPLDVWLDVIAADGDLK